MMSHAVDTASSSTTSTTTTTTSTITTVTTTTSSSSSTIELMANDMTALNDAPTSGTPANLNAKKSKLESMKKLYQRTPPFPCNWPQLLWMFAEIKILERESHNVRRVDTSVKMTILQSTNSCNQKGYGNDWTPSRNSCWWKPWDKRLALGAALVVPFFFLTELSQRKQSWKLKKHR